jgi:hypothetical protein
MRVCAHDGVSAASPGYALIADHCLPQEFSIEPSFDAFAVLE